MTPEKRARLEMLQGYVMLIRKPNDPKWYGPCENSFSLSTEENKTFLFWVPYSNDTRNLKSMGLEWLHRDLDSWKINHPDWRYFIYDARDLEKLPVVLDWETWIDAHEPDDNTLSGIKNKYYARNLRFTVKPEMREARLQTTFEF